VFIAVGALWPPIAFVGGLGYSPLLLLAAVLCLPAGAPKMKFRTYMFVLLAALEFIAASVRWSPKPFSFAEIDPAAGHFALHFEVMKVGFGLLWAAILMAAASTLTPAQARSVVRVATVAILSLVARFVALTSTFAITPPLTSETIPRMAPAVTWAKPALVEKKEMTSRVANR
jgi:hypothetical protein